MSEITISLSEDDFRCLISGGILTLRRKDEIVRIALQDIGFMTMEKALDDIQSGKEIPYKNLDRYE